MCLKAFKCWIRVTQRLFKRSSFWPFCWECISIHYNPINIMEEKKLTHWGRVTHICVSNPTIIGSDNGLSPSWRQAIIWTNIGILTVNSTIRNKLQSNINRNSYVFIQEHAFQMVVWAMAAILSRLQCTLILLQHVTSCKRGRTLAAPFTNMD